MPHRKHTYSVVYNLCRDIFWHIILYFVYFSTFIIWIRLMGTFEVQAQGNFGVIINNTKFDDFKDIHRVVQKQEQVPSPVFIPTIASKATINNTTTTERQFIEIKEIPSQNEKRVHHQVHPTKWPVFIPQTQKQSKKPQKLHSFHGIENILQQNNSDTEKIDEIISKLNKTGNLARVNVFNATRNAVTLRRKTTPLSPTKANESNNKNAAEHQKDSKELKVQFVLDCDLKDMDRTTELVQIPSTSQKSSTVVKKVPVQYPNYQGVFNRIPTKAPVKYSNTKPNIVYYVPTKKTAKPVITTTKPRVKNVYVDPPVVAEIADTFETFYNYFENALTTKVKPKPSNQKSNQKTAKKRPMKRSTIGNSVTPPTLTPNYRYTQSYASENGQKLTTNIQVTSEYVGKEPTKEPTHQNQDYSSASDSLSGYDDSYDDDDDDDDDVDGDRDDDDDDDYDDGFSLGDDYDDDDSSDEDVYDGPPPPNKINLYKKNKRRETGQKGKRVKNKYDSESDEGDYGFGGFSMPTIGGYFRGAYDTISGLVPAVPFFGSDNDDNDDSYDDDDDYSEDDNSKIRIPKLKNSLYSKHRKPPNNEVEETTSIVATSPLPLKSPATESGFFSWFGGSSEEPTEAPVTHKTPPKKNWFSSLFSSESTTIKPEPVVVTTEKTSDTQDSKKWLEMIAHMATMKSPSSTASTMNRTQVLKRKKYDDYQIWRIIPSTLAHLEYLKEYKDSDEHENVVWLKGPAMRGPNDILVPPELNKEVQEILEYESIPYEVLIWDLEKAIKYENPIMSRRQKIELEKEQGHPMTWYRYHNFEDIAIYLDYLQLTYPDLVELIHIGRSFEGRPLMVAKVSFDATEAELSESIPKHSKRPKPSLKTKRRKKVIRPGVFIEAGVHGREWISPAVATWILKELVKFNNTEDGNTEKEMIRSVDWYILPISNPDGYEFSLNYDRLWQKTRSKLPENESMLNLALNWLKRDPTAEAPNCFGTDPDRNYDVEWRKYGSSSACSELYAGPKPLSEPETRAIASFLEENKKDISLFVSLKSYGQFITYPSAKMNATLDASQRSNDLRDMAEVAVNALRDFASAGRYTVDSTNEMSCAKSGTSTDYAMHKVGIKYSYTIELPDTGTQGFLLSPSYIDTTGLEAYEMIKAMVDYL